MRTDALLLGVRPEVIEQVTERALTLIGRNPDCRSIGGLSHVILMAAKSLGVDDQIVGHLPACRAHVSAAWQAVYGPGAA